MTSSPVAHRARGEGSGATEADRERAPAATRIVPGHDEYVARLPQHVIDEATASMSDQRGIGVSRRFMQVVDEFADATPPATTPAGFRIEPSVDRDGTVWFDLVRDISRGWNGEPRPTPLLFSVDTANPYEVEPCAAFVANMTCNPGIVYDLFINDPEANIGHRFHTLEEVLTELGRILGPGSDMSVELNNPFADFGRILEQIHSYEEIVSRHRLVIKVPHTGPVNAANVSQLLEGDKRLNVRYDAGATDDYLYGHRLALKLHEHGYRVNFTLMFEPHQVALALQARPYFINAFLRHRRAATRTIQGLLAAYEATGERAFLVQLRDFFVKHDYLGADEGEVDLLSVLELANTFMRNRRVAGEGADGLDSARHALRWLRTANLEDTRLIICSMEGPTWYPDIMAMLTEPEFLDLHHRIVVTTEPNYLARWSSAPQVVSYQRRFMNAARAANEAAGMSLGSEDR
jgi:hypothetical protein